jgi:hypothetical protein
MGNIRRLILVGLVLFVVLVAYHAATPWKWAAATTPPAGVKVQVVSYTCGAVWGSGYVHGPATTAYPLAGRPCAGRGSYQVLTVLDVFLAVFAIAVLASWGRVVHPRTA